MALAYGLGISEIEKGTGRLKFGMSMDLVPKTTTVPLFFSQAAGHSAGGADLAAGHKGLELRLWRGRAF